MTKINDEEFMGFVPGSGAVYEILPEGSYDFVVHGIIGLGLRPHFFEGKEQKPRAEIKIIYEIPDQIRTSDEKTELLSLKLPVSNDTRSAYYKFCTAVLGQNVTDVEENMEKLVFASGMKSLLGKMGTLTVTAWKNGKGRSVSNKGFYPLHPKAPKPIATREFIFFNPFNPDINVFKENLTAWTRKEIMEALNADQFPKELHDAWEEVRLDDSSKVVDKGTVDDESAPWSGTTDAIQ